MIMAIAKSAANKGCALIYQLGGFDKVLDFFTNTKSPNLKSQSKFYVCKYMGYWELLGLFSLKRARRPPIREDFEIGYFKPKPTGNLGIYPI